MHTLASLEVSSDEDTLLLTASEAAHFIDTYQQMGTELLSLRFAAAPFGSHACLVIGLREGGKGIDLLVPADQCSVLRLGPTSLVVRASAENDELLLEVPWDEQGFERFIDQIIEMRKEMPDHPVWKKLDEVLVDE